MIRINDHITIDESEVRFSTSRSSGPGGQNVNKVETRVTLRFDVDASPSLLPEQKLTIRDRLATRISRDGVLRVVCQKHRTQAANRREVVERFVHLIREALYEAPRRRVTSVPKAAKQQRLDDKKRRGSLKRERTRKPDWND